MVNGRFKLFSRVRGLAVLLLALSACAANPGDRTPSVLNERKILQLLQERLDAVVAGDVAALDAMLAPEFRYIDVHGSMQSREAYLQSKRTSMNTDTDYWISQAIEDAELDFIDKGVVVASVRVLDRFVYQGVQYENPVRSTYVLRKMDGRWLFVLGHTTTIEARQ